MLAITCLSVVLGLASASPQFFPAEPLEHMQARQNFINEYNRLAKLAADAPDIHIIMSNQLPATQTLPPKQPAPVVTQSAPIPNTIDQFAFIASLGGNQQFNPHALTVPTQPAPIQAAPLAGHLAGHLAGASIADPILRWNGPFAHTVPAGVNGLPTQVLDTPEVKAAKAHHFQAHNAALSLVPRVTTNQL